MASLLSFEIIITLLAVLNKIKITEQIEITTSYGNIRGFTENIPQLGNITKFIGIPYARPPVDELRFMKPVRMAAWEETFNATKLGNSCFMSGTPESLTMNSSVDTNSVFYQSEDCLVLNIFYPGDMFQPITTKKTVMVFIHGGGYLQGNSYIYDATLLSLIEDVIVVTFNYRLGLFGFASTEDGSIPGNMGLFDQHAALVWVNENAAAFGGDSAKITIFGESAGGDSIINHIVSPLSNGLFQRAIIQCPFKYRKPSRSEQAAVLKPVYASLNCTENVSCLQNLQASDLHEANLGDYFSSIPVVIDGDFLIGDPLKMLQAGIYNKSIDIIIGFNGHDGDIVTSFFPGFSYTELLTNGVANKETVLEHLQLMWGYFFHQPWNNSPASKTVLDIIYGTYFKDISTPVELGLRLIEMYTDHSFASVVLDVAQRVANQQGNVYVYVFDYRSPYFTFYPNFQPDTSISLSAAHGEDVYYMLGIPAFLGEGTDQLVSLSMIKAWSEFARTGKPNYLTSTHSAVPWQAFTWDNATYFWIADPLTNSSGSQLLPNEWKTKHNLWSNILPQLIGMQSIGQSNLTECVVNGNMNTPVNETSGHQKAELSGLLFLLISVTYTLVYTI